jgi:hypothetical protein
LRYRRCKRNTCYSQRRRQIQREHRPRRTGQLDAERFELPPGISVVGLGVGARFALAVEIEPAFAFQLRRTASLRIASAPSSTLLIGVAPDWRTMVVFM